MRKAYTAEAVHRMLAALVEVIADEVEDRESVEVLLKASPDHSCDIIDRQVYALLASLRCQEWVKASDVEAFFTSDPADLEGQ